MSTHTPTPWTAMAPLAPSHEDHGWRRIATVVGKPGERIIVAPKEAVLPDWDAVANTEYIVRAVNNHANLLEALDNLVPLVVRFEREGETSRGVPLMQGYCGDPACGSKFGLPHEADCRVEAARTAVKEAGGLA